MGIKRYPVSRKRRIYKLKIFVFLLILICVFAFIFILFSLYCGYVLTHPERKVTPPFIENVVPDHEKVEFYDINREIILKGLYFSANTTETVIITHGYKQDKMIFGEDTISIVKFFLDNKYNVLLYDMRGHGESNGNSFTFAKDEKYDIMGAIKYCKSKATKNLVLMGFSFSATANILVANNTIMPAKGIIADSPYIDLEKFVSDNYNKWLNIPKFPGSKFAPMIFLKLFNLSSNVNGIYDIIKNLKDTRILLIQGINDPYLPTADSTDLFASNSEKIDLWQPSSSGHANSFNDYKYMYFTKLAEFLKSLNINKKTN